MRLKWDFETAYEIISNLTIEMVVENSSKNLLT